VILAALHDLALAGRAPALAAAYPPQTATLPLARRSTRWLRASLVEASQTWPGSTTMAGRDRASGQESLEINSYPLAFLFDI
jgi:hypothetical protein